MMLPYLYGVNGLDESEARIFAVNFCLYSTPKLLTDGLLDLFLNLHDGEAGVRDRYPHITICEIRTGADSHGTPHHHPSGCET